MARKRLTMQQIADELGLSRRTVSSVVNDRHVQDGISDETATRVREYLRERRFIPSGQAVQLKKGNTDTVGIIHTGHLYGHLIEAYNQLTNIFSDRRLPMEIMVLNDSNFRDGFMELLGRGITSLVIINYISYRDFKYFDLFDYLEGINTVLYNFCYNEANEEAEKELLHRNFHLVGVDRRQSYQQAAKKLRELGHRTVALPSSQISPANVTPTGIYQAFENVGFNIVAFPNNSTETKKRTPAENGRHYAHNIMNCLRTKGATVACTCDDHIAAFTVDELLKAGLKVPEDISIIGFDCIALSSILQVPLTTVRLPVSQMVNRVSDIVFGKVDMKRNCFIADFISGKSHGPAAEKWKNAADNFAHNISGDQH